MRINSCASGRAVALSAILLASMAPIYSQAHGVEPIALTASAASRGGTQIAIADTALGQLRNPALIGAFKLRRYDQALSALFPIVEWENEFDGDTSRIRIVPQGGFGVVLPWNDKWSFGVAFAAKSGLSSRYKSRYANFMTDITNDQDFKNVELELNASYRVNDELILGFGGRLEAMGLKSRTTLGPSILDWERTTSYGGGFQLGLLWTPDEDWSIGASYRSKTWMGKLSGDARLAIPGMGFIRGEISNGGEDLPRAAAIGVAYTPDEDWRLSLDVRFINNRDSLFYEVDLKGLVNGPLRNGFRNMLIVGAGVEYEFCPGWIASAGYSFNTSPQADETLLHTSAVVLQHSVTAGLRYESDGFWAGIAYGYQFHNRRESEGVTRFPMGVDYANIEVSQQTHHVHIGFGFTF